MVYRVKVLPLAAHLGNAYSSQVLYPIVTNEAKCLGIGQWVCGRRERGKQIEDPQTLTTSFF